MGNQIASKFSQYVESIKNIRMSDDRNFSDLLSQIAKGELNLALLNKCYGYVSGGEWGCLFAIYVLEHTEITEEKWDIPEFKSCISSVIQVLELMDDPDMLEAYEEAQKKAKAYKKYDFKQALAVQKEVKEIK